MTLSSNTANSTGMVVHKICTSFPPLNQNDEPFSMLLRGSAAMLGDLRCTISSQINVREQLLQEMQHMCKENEDDAADNKFGDVDADKDCVVETKMEDMSDEETIQYLKNESINILNSITDPATKAPNDDDVSTHTEQGVGGTENVNVEATDNKKRNRDHEEDDNEEHDECEDDDTSGNSEQLLLYQPSVTCTCSSWKMKDIRGDLFVTTLRVLFLSEKQDGNVGEEKEEQCEDNDVAIDGRYVALHAVDSLPSSSDDNGNETEASHHVYCQLAELGDGDDGMGYPSATNMVTADDDGENNSDTCDEEDIEESSEDDSTIEVYFKPLSDSENHCNKCQNIFDALTKLVSLNLADDTGVGGGLFEMMAMMAGMNGLGNEMMIANHDNDEDDEMVVRLGGSNNLVENDDNESEGAPREERQAMLQRLDDMLVVPPEYEIPSCDDDNGQFSDADEDDEIL